MIIQSTLHKSDPLGLEKKQSDLGRVKDTREKKETRACTVYALNLCDYSTYANSAVTVEPHYNEVLGTMKITLLYQVQGTKTKKYKELGPAKLPCVIKRVLLYQTS